MIKKSTSGAYNCVRLIHRSNLPFSFHGMYRYKNYKIIKLNRWLAGWLVGLTRRSLTIFIIKKRNERKFVIFIKERRKKNSKIRAWFAFHMALEWSPQGLSFIRYAYVGNKDTDDNQRKETQRNTLANVQRRSAQIEID